MSKARIAFYAVAGTAAAALAVAGGAMFYVTRVLPDAGPVPELTVRGDPEQVAHGAYLVNHVATCLVCHSDHDPAIIGMPLPAQGVGGGGPPFTHDDGVPGVIPPPNITPHGIGRWTDGELLHALTTGVTPDHRALWPIMPWEAYAQVAEPDLEAIIAYVRTLRPVPTPARGRVLDSPMDVAVNLMPAPASPPASAPDGSDPVARGAYLANMAGCETCHTMTVEGTPDSHLRYAGGNVFPVPGRGVVRSANLTPDQDSGIGRWTRDEFIGAFKYHLDDPLHGEPLPDGLPTTVMPWAHYAGMTEADLGAIYDFLQTLPPVAHYFETFTLDADSPPRNLSAMPAPPESPEGVPRGALGSLCDTLALLPASGDAILTDEPDATVIAETLARIEHRGHPGGVTLAAALRDLPPPARHAWLVRAVHAHGLDARCGEVLSAAVPPGDAAPPDGAR